MPLDTAETQKELKCLLLHFLRKKVIYSYLILLLSRFSLLAQVLRAKVFLYK